MIKIGYGADIHRLTENRKLILAGVTIPYHLGLLGHSDADVVTHSICDALLGAAAKGDIGKHFPDNDNKYKDINSLLLLKEVKEIILPYKVVNIDVTILAQSPKLAPYILAMRENIARILSVDINNISIKATTTENLGFWGKSEGIESRCVCLLES